MVATLTALTLTMQIQVQVQDVRGIRQARGLNAESSLLVEAAVPLTAKQLAFHFEAVRTTRLAELDQLLALTAKQRQQLSVIFAKVNRKHDDLLHVGTVLKPATLNAVLSKPQRDAVRAVAVIAADSRDPTTTQGQVTIRQDYAIGGELLIERICRDLSCSGKQRRRFQLAIRGGWKRYLQQHEDAYRAISRSPEEKVTSTTDELLRQRTPIPLITEMEIWRKAVKATLTEEQHTKYEQLESERARLYRWANAMAMTGILQIDHNLTTRQCRQLATLVESRFDPATRVAFPILEQSHPLLNLTIRELQTVLPFDVANAVHIQLQQVREDLKPVISQ